MGTFEKEIDKLDAVEGVEGGAGDSHSIEIRRWRDSERREFWGTGEMLDESSSLAPAGNGTVGRRVTPGFALAANSLQLRLRYQPASSVIR